MEFSPDSLFTVKRMLDDCFPEQRNFILEKAKKKMALCSRRAAKTFSAGINICRYGLLYEKCSMVYATMTQTSAKRIMVKDIVQPLNAKYQLGLTVVGNTVQFPNGSICYLVGIDKDEQEKDKLLGVKNRLCVIDEAQDITIDLQDLIDRVLSYTLLDYNGELNILGTASNNTSTYFYELTKDYKDKAGYKYHHWTYLQNPHVRKQALKMLHDKLRDNPNYQQTNTYKQQDLAQWTIEKSALCYHYNDNNFIEALPPNDNYVWFLIVDLGYKDADGFVEVCFAADDPKLYIYSAYKQTGNDDFATAYHIQHMAKLADKEGRRYSRIIVDGSNLKSVETMRQRFGLPLIATDKGKKADYIRLMNVDLDRGTIKILPQAAEHLKKEWDRLIWDPKKPGKEKEGLENHLADAALYGWRTATNWNYLPSSDPVYTEAQKAFGDHLLNQPTTLDQLENDQPWSEEDYGFI